MTTLEKIRAEILNFKENCNASDYLGCGILDVIDKYAEQEPVLDKIRAEIDRQEKWLLQAGYTAYNADIAFDAIKSVLAESEGKG